MAATRESLRTHTFAPASDWRRMTTEETNVLLRPTSGGGHHVLSARPELLHRDGSDRPVLSATFVCRRQPSLAANESLHELIEYATLALGLTVHPTVDTLIALGRRIGKVCPAPLAEFGFTLLRHGAAEPLTGIESPHGAQSAALAATLAGADAVALLGALRGVDSTLRIRATLVPQASSVGQIRLWQADLAVVSRLLADRADDSRIFYAADIEGLLGVMIERGIVAGDGAHPDAAALVAAAFLRAASPILSRLDDDERVVALGARYRFRCWSGGPMTVRFRHEAASDDTAPLTLNGVLSEMLARSTTDPLDPATTRFVAHDGVGRLVPLNERRVVSAHRRSRGGVAMVSRGEQVLSLSAALRPTSALSSNPALSGLHVPAQVPGSVLADSLVMPGGDRRRSLPIITDGVPLWVDRRNARRRWYPPTFTLPAPEVGGRHPGFSFHFRTVGHDLQGRPGLEGTATFVLDQGMIEEVREAIAALPEGIRVSAIVPRSLSAHLDVPFRDENGVNRVEPFPARDLVLDGGKLTAVFAFTDRWTRIAYGALAYEGFQAQAVTLRVAYQHDAYEKRRESMQWTLAAGAKRVGFAEGMIRPSRARAADDRTGVLRLADGSVIALPDDAPGKAPRARPSPALMTLAPNRIEALKPSATVQLRPELMIAPTLSTSLERVRFVETTRRHTRSITATVPCERYGHSYTEEVAPDAGPVTIGCREAFQLGETPHRVYEPVVLPASLARSCRVLRVLTSPGRFVVVPSTFTITRHGADAGERAWQPCVLLFSTIDIEALERSRCVIACTLSAELEGAELTRLADHLRRNVDPAAVLEPIVGRADETVIEWSLPSGAGNALELRIETVETGTGFEASLSTDAFGLPQIAEIMRHVGIVGSARFTLSDGTRASTTLRLDLGRINGPAPSGPVMLDAGEEGIVLRNALSSAVTVDTALRTDESGLIVEERVLGALIEPGGTLDVDAPSGQWALDARVSGTAELPEIRSFAEDITVSVLLLDRVRAADADGDAASIALDIRVRATDIAASVRFDGENRMLEQSFVLPLTLFLDEPTLELELTLEHGGTRASHGPLLWNLGRDGYLLTLTAEAFGLV